MPHEPVVSLKILLLCYVRTADHALCRIAGGYPRSQAYRFVKETQRRLQPWNARLPSSIELCNLREMARHIQTVSSPAERSVLRALERALHILAVTSSPWQARELFLDAHAAMRDQLAAILPQRKRRMVRLLHKLERDITQASQDQLAPR